MEKINNYLIKYYKILFTTFIVFVVLSLTFALGYLTQYSHPDVTTLKVFYPNTKIFFDDAQLFANVLFYMACFIFFIALAVFNLRLKKGTKMNIFVFGSRAALSVSLIVFASLLLVFSINLRSQFIELIKPLCTEYNFPMSTPPTTFTFDLALVFAPILIIISLLQFYVSFIIFIKEKNNVK